MITEEQFQAIVEEVIRRLFGRVGDTSRRRSVIVVFTGATVGLSEGIRQVRSLLLREYRVQLVFSRAAGHLYVEMVRQEFSGFPNLCLLIPERWLSALKEAEAVTVPLLSLNSVSKLSLLIADDLVSNVLLHSLLLGKPLVLAKDGADPDSEGRRALGFHQGNSTLNNLMRQRLKILEELGCILTGVGMLADTVCSVIENGALRQIPAHHRLSARPSITVSGQVATSGDVVSAHRKGANLNVGPAGLVTPLARDLAARFGVELVVS